MFSDRIRRRMTLWWGDARGRWPRLDDLRRLEMLLSTLPAGAPDGRLRRGPHWQRRLSNKLSSREFARAHGCRVPTLFWTGRRLRRSRLESLPARVVVKPAVSTVRRGAYAMDGSRELLRGATMSRGELYEVIRAERGRFSPIPLLAEELLGDVEPGRALPADVRFHVFGEVIGAIQVVERTSGPGMPAAGRFYTPSWEPFDDPMFTRLPLAPLRSPPACLAEMRDVALRLGRAYDTFVRIDLYATRAGCVFGELSSTPYRGRGFTPYADRLFGSLWERHLPGKV